MNFMGSTAILRRGIWTRAFTLIELLVVIAIIAILAGLILSGVAAGGAAKYKARLQTQMAEIETAINEYYAKKGSYPPSNPANITRPTLYYELVGTLFDGKDTYLTLDGTSTKGAWNPGVAVADAQTFFGIQGFQNSGRIKGESENYYVNLAAKGRSILPGAPPNIQLLSAPIRNDNASDPQHVYWHYNSHSPTNNPGKYDLWVEWVHQGKTDIIGNFKK